MIKKSLNDLIAQSEQLRQTKKPVVLFGAKSLGVIVKQILDSAAVSIYCFCDNNAELQGSNIEGIPVLSIETLAAKQVDCKIVICSSYTYSISAIEKQLTAFGFTDFCDILPAYILKKHPLSKAEAVCGQDDSTPPMIIDSMEVDITEKCSLRCKECGSLMPHFKNPVNYNTQSILQSVQALSRSVDLVGRAIVIGGEPFMHPNLAEICRGIAEIPNISTIQITTNGTIVPSDEVLKELSRCVDYVTISDYGSISANKEKLMAALKRFGINCEIRGSYNTWESYGDPYPRHRTEKENEELYAGCRLGGHCLSLCNGRFQLCSRANFAAALGLLPSDQVDGVEVPSPDKSSTETRAEIYHLLTQTRTISFCDYCDGSNGVKVPRAEQI